LLRVNCYQIGSTSKWAMVRQLLNGENKQVYQSSSNERFLSKQAPTIKQ